MQSHRVASRHLHAIPVPDTAPAPSNEVKDFRKWLKSQEISDQLMPLFAAWQSRKGEMAPQDTSKWLDRMLTHVKTKTPTGKAQLPMILEEGDDFEDGIEARSIETCTAAKLFSQQYASFADLRHVSDILRLHAMIAPRDSDILGELTEGDDAALLLPETCVHEIGACRTKTDAFLPEKPLLVERGSSSEESDQPSYSMFLGAPESLVAFVRYGEEDEGDSMGVSPYSQARRPRPLTRLIRPPLHRSNSSFVSHLPSDPPMRCMAFDRAMQSVKQETSLLTRLDAPRAQRPGICEALIPFSPSSLAATSEDLHDDDTEVSVDFDDLVQQVFIPLLRRLVLQKNEQEGDAGLD